MINGHHQVDQRSDDAARAEATAQVRQFVETVVSTVMNGLVNSGPAIPGELIIELTCEVVGRTVGNMYVGEDAAVQAFRRKCRDAFCGALRSTPVRTPPRQVDAGASLAAMSVGSTPRQ